MVRTTCSPLALVALCLVCGSVIPTLAQDEKDHNNDSPMQLQNEDFSSAFRSSVHRNMRVLEEPMLILDEEDLLDELQHNDTMATHDDEEEDHADDELLSGVNATDEADHDAHEGEDDHGDDHHDDEYHEGEDEHDHDHDHDSESAASSLLLDDHDEDKPWGDVIVASILINLITLVGVFFFTGEFVAKHVCKKDVDNSPYYKSFTHNIIPSFACGALLATTVFLVLPESLYLISSHFAGGDGEGGHAHRFLEEEGDEHAGEESESAAVWRFGACVIGGFLLPVLTGMLFPHNHEDLEEQDISQAYAATAEETDKLHDLPEALVAEEIMPPEQAGTLAEEAYASKTTTSKSPLDDHQVSNVTAGSAGDSDDGDLVVTAGDKTLPHAINYSLAASIMAGDFFHNFADGIFVGTAFMLCSRDLAIAISAATIYHEIAQEIADYFMLTRFCHLPPIKALFLNFINGLSVLFGALLIVGIDDITNVAIGSILGVSGGVYLFIAIAECFPRAKEAQKTLQDKLIAFAAFVVGVIPIGLVLLNHGHCEAEGGH